MTSRPGDALSPEQAFRWACCLELRALKPGNVASSRPGHDMSGRDFTLSARRSAPWLAAPNASLGERIYRAVAATRKAVGCNTNLGIVLLCAPLLRASQQRGERPLARTVAEQIAEADRADTDWVFRAIRLAAPGGLGEAPRHDVRGKASVALAEAMAEAAHRDRVAREYATDFAQVLGPGRAHLERLWQAWNSPTWATAAVFLRYLAMEPDSHVLRRHGAAVARDVTREASRLEPRLAGAADPRELRPDLLDLDRDLRARGINPGTCADLAVATVCAALLEPLTAPRDAASSARWA